MIIHCSGCGCEVEVPDELVGDVDPDEWNSGVIELNSNYFCDECEPARKLAGADPAANGGRVGEWSLWNS